MRTYRQIKLPTCPREEHNGVRYYRTPEGNLYPSITTVLSVMPNEALEKWKKELGDEAKRIASRAAARGTVIHAMCESLLTKHPPGGITPNPFYNDMWQSFKPMVEQVGDVYAIETQMYSDYLKVAGTVDCVGMWRGKLSIIDFKTSSRRKSKEDISSYFMQEAAYAVCWEERTKQPITQLVTLMAVEDDEPMEFIEHRDNWIHEFIKLRKLYKETYEKQ